MSLNARLKVLERSRGKGCPDCRGKQEVVVSMPDDPKPPANKFCKSCGRDITLRIVVTYDEPNQGAGGHP